MFFYDEIQYQDYEINKHGLSSSKIKIKAIVEISI